MFLLNWIINKKQPVARLIDKISQEVKKHVDEWERFATTILDQIHILDQSHFG